MTKNWKEVYNEFLLDDSKKESTHLIKSLLETEKEIEKGIKMAKDLVLKMEAELYELHTACIVVDSITRKRNE